VRAEGAHLTACPLPQVIAFHVGGWCTCALRIIDLDLSEAAGVACIRWSRALHSKFQGLTQPASSLQALSTSLNLSDFVVGIHWRPCASRGMVEACLLSRDRRGNSAERISPSASVYALQTAINRAIFIALPLAFLPLKPVESGFSGF
jgi:hypothetical protein